MNKKNNRKGFTTVELVIVIAVIAILAAVLIPTFSSLINKANESAALQEATSTFKSYLIAKAETVKSTDVAYVFVVDDSNNIEYIFKATGTKIDNKPVADNKDDIDDFKCKCTDALITADSTADAGYKAYTPADGVVEHTGPINGEDVCSGCGVDTTPAP